MNMPSIAGNRTFNFSDSESTADIISTNFNPNTFFANNNWTQELNI
jgi:hypothetical protein